MKVYRAKIGTHATSSIIVDGRNVIGVGKKIRWRYNKHGTKWQYGLVWKIQEDGGYLFIEL